MPPLSPPQPPSSATPAGKSQSDIVVIPEKYYGVALKMEAGALPSEVPTPPPAPPKPAPVMPVAKASPEQKRSPWPIVGGIVAVLLIVSGGFIYFSRDLLFPKPPEPTPAPPTPVVKEPPSAAASLTAALASGSAVSLNWADTSSDESGYRIERKEQTGTYVPVTNLPADSRIFLDVTAQAGKTYAYHVIALGEGGESAPSNEASIVIPEATPIATPSPTLPPGGLDSDSDGLSDQEEVIFSTDPQKPDSDGDSFNDGNEVFHLYDPSTKAPSRLVDSGLVQVLSSPAGWSLFVPTKWSKGLDTPDGSHATVTTGSGESFVLEILNNPQQQSLSDWYLAQNAGLTSSDVRTFTTKGGLSGLFSQDRLIAYFAWGDKILSIRYDLDGQVYVNYRTVFEMMLNSLTLNGAPIVSTLPSDATTGPGTLVGTTSTAAIPETTTTSSAPAETSSTTTP